MKKYTRFFIMLFALSVMMCMTVLAAEADDVFVKEAAGATFEMDESNEKFTVSYTGATSGQYLILMVSADGSGNYTITENSIQYVDQKAGGTGGISFTVYPAKMVKAQILLAGGSQSPVVLGEYAPKGVTVSGTVTSFLSETEDVTIRLLDGETEVATQVVKGNTAEYSFSGVAAGDYTLEISKKGHGTYVEAITVSTNVEKDYSLYIMGDVNRNGKVNGTDALHISQNYAGSRAFDDYQKALGDVNGNGKVNGTDALWVLQRYAGARDDYYAKTSE